MNARALSRSLERSRARAEARHLPAMEEAYEKLIRRAGREASANLAAQTVTAAIDWQPPPEGTLFDQAAQAAAAEAALARAHRRVLRAVAGPPLERIGIAWDIAHPLSVELLANAAQRTGEALGEAVQFILREAIAEAYEHGLAVTDAADLIRDRIGEAAPWQAEMLARTDLNGLSNGGSVMAAKLAGVETKTWLTAADERVRPEHQAANGQTVPIDQPFQVCGEQLAFPGDPVGSDGCVANCRCSVIYGEPLATPRTAAAVKEDTMSETATDTATTVAWVSDVAFEGAATEDGRFILPDALDWRELPLTLMALTETGPGGHEGAFAAGKMEAFEKDAEFDMDGDPLPDGVTAVRSTGVFDMGGENGTEVARLVEGEFVRGVSVDLVVLEWALRDPETGELFDPADMNEELFERFLAGELQEAVVKGTIMAATVCPTPAFADARIVVTASGERARRLTLWAPLEVVDAQTALVAAARLAAPAAPPREWFLTDELPGPTPLTITDEGRVFGHLALWESCHTGFAGTCVRPTRSPSNYAYLHVGEIETAEGDCLPVGKLMFGTKHAPLHLQRQEASRHYDDTGRVAAFLRARDGKHGIWVAGALRSGLTAEQLREVRANPPSGDWRPVNRQLDMVAALCVPVPGYPIPRAEAGLIASGEEIEVGALIVSSGEIVPDTAVRAAMVAAGLTHDDLTIDDLAALAQA